jgi:hypothetical protein
MLASSVAIHTAAARALQWKVVRGLSGVVFRSGERAIDDLLL